MRLSKLVVLLIVLSTTLAITSLPVETQQLIIYPRVLSQYQNSDCEENNTCDLLSIDFRAEDYEVVTSSGKSYGTRMFAAYTTREVGDLEKYVFVQFIRGCVYSTELKKKGKVLVLYDVSRRHFNVIKPFSHPNWQVDSLDDNPVFLSARGKPLHYYYRWNTVNGSMEKETEYLYGMIKPSQPTLYVSDRPGTVFVSGKRARNRSLQFLTCLYKVAAVPDISRPEDIDFGRPIQCFEWYSSYVYNFKTKKYERTEIVSPVCRGE